MTQQTRADGDNVVTVNITPGYGQMRHPMAPTPHYAPVTELHNKSYVSSDNAFLVIAALFTGINLAAAIRIASGVPFTGACVIARAMPQLQADAHEHMFVHVVLAVVTGLIAFCIRAR